MSCTDKALTRQIELYECTVTKYMTAISNAIQQVVKLLFLSSCALKSVTNLAYVLNCYSQAVQEAGKRPLC